MAGGRSRLALAALLVVSLGCASAGSTPRKAGSPSSAEETPRAEQDAVEASGSWLALVDGARYEQSWSEAAELFRNAVPKEQWSTQVGAVRRPLGAVLQRTLKRKQYATSLPGVPDGEYVVIQYETTFENKKAAVETVTPMREMDGRWRVSGYYVR